MKNLTERCFCLFFLALLVIPFLFTNFKHNQTSEIDNSYLPELQWDESTSADQKISDIENYLNMRIGFREQFLNMYQVFNDRLFGLMEHPLYMYGEDGYVYFKFWSYIVDYQHLNLDQQYADDFAHAMRVFSDLSEERGADFYYLLIPDKKTIYPEYFPKGINQRGNVSRTDQILYSLGKADVNYLFLYDVLTEAKEHDQVFNVKFDAGHWNDTGAFYSMCELYRRLREDHPEIPMLTKEAYDTKMIHVDSLPVSHFAIDEEVPSYSLRNSTAVSDLDWMNGNLSFPDENAYRTRFVNPEKRDLPKILLFHDSYMMGKEIFFTENFSEVTFIHRYNLLGSEELEAYLNALNPDIVVFENPEASFGFQFALPEEKE